MRLQVSYSLWSKFKLEPDISKGLFYLLETAHARLRGLARWKLSEVNSRLCIRHSSSTRGCRGMVHNVTIGAQ